MAEVAWDNNCKTCKAMVTVIAAILMLVVVLMLRLVLQCPITGKLLVDVGAVTVNGASL